MTRRCMKTVEDLVSVHNTSHLCFKGAVASRSYEPNPFLSPDVTLLPAVTEVTPEVEAQPTDEEVAGQVSLIFKTNDFGKDIVDNSNFPDALWDLKERSVSDSRRAALSLSLGMKRF